MSNILSRDRAAVPSTSRRVAFLSNAVTTPHRHRMALLAGCAFAAAALALSSAPVMAGCNSGDTGNTSLLTSANCQATAGGAGAIAVGRFANAPGFVAVAVGDYASASFNYTTAIGGVASACR